MSQWQFHSSSQPSKHKKEESGCSPFNKPFESRPKIGRTPMVVDRIQTKSDNSFKNHVIGQSPVMSYFIPNTPFYKKEEQKRMNHRMNVVEEEPGSDIVHSKRDRKRRRSSTASQPEGTFSPIPRSKFLSELNESFNGLNKNKRVLLMEDEKEESPFVSSELSQSNRKRIRSEVLAEIERMENQITQEMNDVNLLLNPSPSSLLTAIKELQITEGIKEKEREVINDVDDRIHFSQIIVKYCLNKDIWCNLLNFVWIIIILMLYWNIVDFQWR